MNFNQIEKLLIKNGWFLVRTIGSSHQYRKLGNLETVIISNRGNEVFSDYFLIHLEKTTGLSLMR